MIFTLFFISIIAGLNKVLLILPPIDQTILDKETEFINYILPKFQSVGYYYLPMAQLLYYLKLYIGIWLAVFGIKLFFKIANITSLGFIKPL